MQQQTPDLPWMTYFLQRGAPTFTELSVAMPGTVQLFASEFTGERLRFWNVCYSSSIGIVTTSMHATHCPLGNHNPQLFEMEIAVHHGPSLTAICEWTRISNGCRIVEFN